MISELIAGRFVPKLLGQTVQRMTGIGSTAVAQVEAPGSDMTRSGRRFYLAYNGTTPTGIAPVQALPTTAAQWVIFNGDSNKAYAFRALGVMPASGTVGVGQLLAALFQGPSQAGLALATGMAIASGSAGGLTSKAVVKSAITLSAPAVPLWIPIAETPSPNVGAFPGSGIIANRQLEGRLVVPPLWGVGLVTLALAGTTPLFIPFAEWEEVELDLE